MKPIRWVTVSCLFIFSLDMQHAVAQKKSLTVALFDFEAKDKKLQEVGVLIRDLIEAELTGQEGLRLVTRTEMEEILEEQKISLAGITEESAPQIGRLLGAEVMIVGRVFLVGDQLYGTARLFGTETSRSFGEKAKKDYGDVDQLAEELATKIASRIRSNQDDLDVPVRLPENQIKELKEKLGQGDLPRVYVYINERVVGAPVIDPAAQTEFQHILLKSGFNAIKDKSGVLKTWSQEYLEEGGIQGPPEMDSVDLIVIGEGLSQFASRTGDLISSRARLEVEILDPKTGEAFSVDRETTVAVDLSEQIGAKTALQEAAGKLAFRMIPEAVEKWRKSKETKG